MERKLDKYGFPIPATFDDLPEKMQREKSPLSEKPKLSERGFAWKRRIIMAMMVAIFAVVVGVQFRKPIMRWIAESQAETGQRAYFRQEFEDAKRHYGRAMWLDETNLAYRLQHASAAEKLSQFDEAHRDLTFIIDIKDSKRESYEDQKRFLHAFQIEALRQRAYLQFRMEKAVPALADMNQALELSEQANPGTPNSQFFIREIPELLNARAYLRALIKTELKEGLADVNRALQMSNEVPEFLDTRGYLYCLTEDFEKALADLDPSIERLELDYNQFRRSRFARERFQARQLRESLAVMYYHRSLAHKGLRNIEKANEDSLRAAEYGYDPQNGVF